MPASLLRLRSDEQLVASFRGGSEAAFAAIHDRYRARLLAYSRQMLGGSRQDAEDVLQDVFVRVYRSLRANDRPISLRAWLYRIAHNRCIDQLRGGKPAPADVFEMSRTPQPDPPTVVERREDLQRLVTDVRRLPDQQRSALLMRELQGMSYEELASSLDVSVAAVKSLLVRARSGLVDAAEARDTACAAVRRDLALACDRGVRSSGLARRHLRDCPSCREYRAELRGVQRRLGALVPVGPLGLLGGLGGVGGGAAAGGSVGAGAGASGAILTATKVALVCAAAAVTAQGALGIAPKSLVPAFHDPAPASAPRPMARTPTGDAAISAAAIRTLDVLSTRPSLTTSQRIAAALITPAHPRRRHSPRPAITTAVAPLSEARPTVAITGGPSGSPTGGTSAPSSSATTVPLGATGPTSTPMYDTNMAVSGDASPGTSTAGGSTASTTPSNGSTTTSSPSTTSEASSPTPNPPSTQSPSSASGTATGGTDPAATDDSSSSPTTGVASAAPSTGSAGTPSS